MINFDFITKEKANLKWPQNLNLLNHKLYPNRIQLNGDDLR